MENKKLKLLVCALAIGLSVSLASADIETGLVGHWTFDDGSGTIALDSSGNGNDGTLMGSPEWKTTGDDFRVGTGALDFAYADNDYVNCGNDSIFNIADEITVSVWINVHEFNQRFQVVISKESASWMLSRNSTTDNLRWYCIGITGDDGTGYVTGTVPVNDGEWHHIVGVYDGSTISLYTDGVLDASQPASGTINTNDHPVWISGRATRTDRWWNGLIDDVRVYNRGLSAEEVLALWASDPDFNFAPQVDAGEYQSIVWPGNSVQLDGTVSDDGKPADPCEVTITWSKLSGPGTVGFSDAGIEDPIVTFTAAGAYELQLHGYDGEKDAYDTVKIFVQSDNNDPIAHWDFETGSGTNVVDRSINNNFGTFVGEPNWVPGWVGDWALECAELAYVDITPDAVADPNLDTMECEVSVSTWVKIDSWGAGVWNGIVTKGDGRAGGPGGWSLIRVSSSDNLAFYTPDAGYVGGSFNIRDGYWHHVAAVHDGFTTSLYVDGQLDGSAAASGPIKPNIARVWINGNSEYPDDRYINGNIDDVRVYNYGLSAAQVADLAAMGSLIPIVDAGEDQVFSMQNDFVQLDGTVTDDGNPVAATLEWTQESGPGTVTFSDTGIVNPTATFSEVGTYVLRLTADDTMAAIYDEVTITAENPTCQDVIDNSLLIAGDFSGPDGIPDCYIDLYDFPKPPSATSRYNHPWSKNAEFLSLWFHSNMPTAPG